MKLFFTLFISLSSFIHLNGQSDPALLRSFGNVSLIAVYNTYYLLGATYDAYSNKIYTQDQVIDIADRQLSLIESALSSLRENKPNQQNGFSQGDLEMVAQMIKCFEGMSQQAKHLKKYAIFDIESDSDAFLDQSDMTWKSIRALVENED